MIKRLRVLNMRCNIDRYAYDILDAIHRSSRFFIVLGAIVILIVQADMADAQTLIRNFTPEVWKADPVPWSGDLDRDKIDDAITGPGPFDIIVNYNRCVDDFDIATLTGMIAPGTIQMQSKYLSSVLAEGVYYAQVSAVAQRPEVAFIELQAAYDYGLDVSVPNICVAPGAAGGACLGDVETLGFTGNGINIVIIDSGVDDINHDAFTGAYLGGYRARDNSMTNPTDEVWHGTAVASVALGRQWTSGSTTYRGVARSAGLYDVSVHPISTVNIYRGLEKTYDNHQDGTWTVHVINMSIWAPGVSHDGTESMAQLIDLAESIGIVVVAIAGNGGPDNDGISNPGAATRAITVAASNDHGTANRDDALWDSSSRGPRADDGDDDDVDELKPEVTANGENITMALRNTKNGIITDSGTSHAGPHVAGLAALIMEARLGINAASVKELIISTAEQKGTGAGPYGWDNGWGWGLIDAHDAVAAAVTTDLTYPNHPADPSWMSEDISVSPAPQEGQQTTVTVQIENEGPVAASNARIHFGVYVFSASTPTFQDIGTQIVDLPVGITPVQMDWTPAEDGHQCMKVEIGYGADNDYTNNRAQRNLRVAKSEGDGGLSVAEVRELPYAVPSPVTFWVQNTHSETAELIEFEPSFEVVTDPPWTVSFTPPYVILGADDCPVEVTAQLNPSSIALLPGFTQTLYIEATIEDVTLGGVAVEYTQPSPSPYWIVRDIDLFQDTFPTNETSVGTGRVDMAQDILPKSSSGILPGDSACVTVTDPEAGLGIDPTNSGPAVYCYISVDHGTAPAYTALAMQAAETRTGAGYPGDLRFPYTGTMASAGRTWEYFRMDTIFAYNGALVADRYCIDLNDNLFTNGDTLWFIFGAMNATGKWTWWSQGSGTVGDMGKACAVPMEMQILPAQGALDGDILYVNNYDGNEAQSYFNWAFRSMNILDDIDRYDVRGPSSGVGNRPGSRVRNVLNQLIQNYNKIIWNTGDLPLGNIGDGVGYEKSDDASMLFTFLDLHTSAVSGIYFSGDDLADEWSTLTGAGAIALRAYMSYTVVNPDHVGAGAGVNPYIVDAAGPVFQPGDQAIAYGGCPLINDFDVVAPNPPTSTAEMDYARDTGAGPGALVPSAIVSQQTTNAVGNTVRIVMSGFSFHYLRDDGPAAVPNRYIHMQRILNYLNNYPDEPTAVRPNTRVNSLAQNYPNPFNPTTTIKYTVKDKEHVSLKIYNVTGQLVRTLVDEVKQPGVTHTVEWDGRNNADQTIASGVYFYRFVTKNFTQTKKLVLLK